MRVVTRGFFLGARALQLGSTLLHNCAAATLTLAELRADIHDRWQTFEQEHEDVERGLLPWETQAADRLARPGRSVLIVGCGSGREMLAYLERGCRVTAVDPAERALGVARAVIEAHGFSAALIQGFIEDTRVPGEFDLVLFGRGCYSLIPERSRRTRVLRQLATQLHSDGVMCVNHLPFLRSRDIVTRTARVVGALARSDWRVEPGDVIEWRQYGNGVPFFGYQHSFAHGEIEQEAAIAGLRVAGRLEEPNPIVLFLQPQRPAASRQA